MSYLKLLIVLCCFISIHPSYAEESNELPAGFISDELFIYMHSGAGTNFRIVGSITAGSEIKLAGKIENGFTQIVDPKSREAWVESKYVSSTPGLRFVIAELNEKLATTEQTRDELTTQLAQKTAELDNTLSNQNKLEKDIETLNQSLAQVNGKLDNQDLQLKKEWFFTGATVLVIGLLFGLVIPKLSGGKKRNMANWK